jgi:N-acetylneuraminic acid mutarotase
MRLTKQLSLAGVAGLVLACQGSPDLGPDSSPEPVASTGVDALVASNTWSTKAPMPFGRSFLGAAANNGILYAVGGGFRDQNGNPRPSTNLQAYDLRTNTWSARKPLPVAWAWGDGASFINGRLYITGNSKALYVYDPATDRWTRKADMPQAVFYGSQGVIAGRLYVYAPAGALLRYDPATNTWTKRAPPPLIHGEMAAAGVIGGKLYVAGGAFQYDPLANVYAYDPVANAWSARAPMPKALFGMASAVIDKKLYVAGGDQCFSCDGLRTLYVYDPVTNSWTVKSPMPAGHFAAAGAVAQGQLYVVGGFTAAKYGITRVDVYTP